jgi:hypothetical protein
MLRTLEMLTSHDGDGDGDGDDENEVFYWIDISIPGDSMTNKTMMMLMKQTTIAH